MILVTVPNSPCKRPVSLITLSTIDKAPPLSPQLRDILWNQRSENINTLAWYRKIASKDQLRDMVLHDILPHCDLETASELQDLSEDEIKSIVLGIEFAIIYELPIEQVLPKEYVEMATSTSAEELDL